MRTPLLTTLAALTVGLAACGTQPSGDASRTQDADLGPALTRLAEGLSKADLAGFPSTVDPNPQLGEMLRGMDGLLPTVTVAAQRRTGPNVTAELAYSWALPGGPWTYTTQAGLTWQNGAWQLAWQPSVVHPKLTYETRLVHTWTQAERGRITGQGGTPLTETQLLNRVGIDKARVPADQAEVAARRLAAAYQVDADKYAAAVRSAGAQQFVEALTVRANFPEPAGWRQIPGAISVPVRRSVAIDRELAPELIGVVGEATPQQIADSHGTLFAGDQAGLSGLQRRWDDSLRGASSTRIALAPRASATPAASAAPGAPTPTPRPAETIFQTPAVQGADLATGLDPALQ